LNDNNLFLEHGESPNFQCSFIIYFQEETKKTKKKQNGQLGEKIPNDFYIADIMKNRQETADQTIGVCSELFTLLLSMAMMLSCQ
jgi:hypothetical protein